MKALVLVFSMLIASAAAAQDRRSELDKAYEEARAAQMSLKEAEARRDEGIEAQAGDRQGTASGGTRPTQQYVGRQQLLEQELEVARRRYDAALKRWNDLK
jgi:uncharacterized protein (DUF2126 family)